MAKVIDASGTACHSYLSITMGLYAVPQHSPHGLRCTCPKVTDHSNKTAEQLIMSRLDGSYFETAQSKPNKLSSEGTETKSTLLSKKYKPVALKVRPVKAELDEEFRIKRHITGDPLKDLPELPVRPPDFVPTGRYTQERKEIIDKMHNDDFLWPEERKLMHDLMKNQEKGFAWSVEEGGTFRTDFFPPIKFPVLPHKPWVERNIPIPPGIYEEVCKILKDKMDVGVYEPSTSSYRSKWFMVVKKDGKSL